MLLEIRERDTSGHADAGCRGIGFSWFDRRWRRVTKGGGVAWASSSRMEHYREEYMSAKPMQMGERCKSKYRAALAKLTHRDFSR